MHKIYSTRYVLRKEENFKTINNYSFIYSGNLFRKIRNEDFVKVKTIVLNPEGKDISGELNKFGYSEKYDINMLNLKLFYKSQTHDYGSRNIIFYSFKKKSYQIKT